MVTVRHPCFVFQYKTLEHVDKDAVARLGGQEEHTRIVTLRAFLVKSLHILHYYRVVLHYSTAKIGEEKKTKKGKKGKERRGREGGYLIMSQKGKERRGLNQYRTKENQYARQNSNMTTNGRISILHHPQCEGLVFVCSGHQAAH